MQGLEPPVQRKVELLVPCWKHSDAPLLQRGTLEQSPQQALIEIFSQIGPISIYKMGIVPPELKLKIACCHRNAHLTESLVFLHSSRNVADVVSAFSVDCP